MSFQPIKDRAFYGTWKSALVESNHPQPLEPLNFPKLHSYFADFP